MKTKAIYYVDYSDAYYPCIKRDKYPLDSGHTNQKFKDAKAELVDYLKDKVDHYKSLMRESRKLKKESL